MNYQPVDLSNLREAIDNDREVEQELFDEFIQSSKDQLKILDDHVKNENDNTCWMHAAHALKSTSGSLGAVNLSRLCAEGQRAHEADKTIKMALYKQINEEYAKVLAYLETA